ncbi:MAG TPA: nitrite reductase, partial [Methanocorpusculum sp.]|nr:nitrite reductase [Methanocorpusculum sp.]
MADPNLYLKGGVIPERDNEHYIIRLRTPAGMLGVDALAGIAEIAKKYGIQDTHLTTRQTIELLHVGPEILDDLLADLEKNGTPIGAERNEVVNVTACLGNANCKYSVIDTISLAKKLDEKHFGKEMPVKVRIAISGC